VYRQLIAINPARSVKAPGREVYAQKFYTEVQITALLQALAHESPRFRAMVLLALSTGIRRGELVALEWGHIDFQVHTIRICQAAELITGNPQRLKATKTHGSLRTVVVPEITQAALREWQQLQGNERLQAGTLWQHSAFIFTQPLGHWVRADEVSKQFRKFLKRHRLPILPFHGLRHTVATLLIAQGLPVRTVANVLGHTQTSTTLNIYSHVLESSTRHAAEIMDELLAQSVQGATMSTIDIL